MNMHVPERAERWAKWSLAPWERQAVLGDLQEEFLNIAETSGADDANRWYWRHVLLSLWPNIVRRARGDEYRANRIHQTAGRMAQGVLFIAIGALPTRRGAPPSVAYFGLGLLYITTGLFDAGTALLRQRVRLPASGRTRIVGVSMLVLTSLLLALAFTPAVRLSKVGIYMPLALVLLLFAGELMARRGAYAPATQYVVRRTAAPAESTDRWLELDVPNAPLALSSLVLCHGQALLAADGVHSGAPTIERSFQRSDVLRCTPSSIHRRQRRRRASRWSRPMATSDSSIRSPSFEARQKKSSGSGTTSRTANRRRASARSTSGSRWPISNPAAIACGSRSMTASERRCNRNASKSARSPRDSRV